jgi:hypothetical protein
MHGEGLFVGRHILITSISPPTWNSVVAVSLRSVCVELFNEQGGGGAFLERS